MKKKIIRKIVWFLLILLLGAGILFVWPRLPIITAFASKGMCSSVFLAGKDPARVMAEDLSFFPISVAKTEVNYKEKSATSTVLGLAKRKAIYREGLGSAIVLKTPEKELKTDYFRFPDPGYSQDTIPWPLGDIVSDTMVSGVDYGRLQTLLDTSFDRTGEEAYKKTLGIAIVYDNQLIAEKYLGDYNEHTMFHGWSMTKTVCGALAGILFDEGRIKLDSPVDISEWSGDDRKNITLRNVIQMTTGLDWYENYFTISDATVMLMQSDDMLSSVVESKLANEPGTVWNYSSGDANLLSGIIRNEIKNDDKYHAFAYKELIYRIGMLNTVIETDASGLFVASSYSYGSTRDWARFGLLFLNNGIFEGDTILSEEWVNFMKKATPASDGSYAATFWRKEPSPENALKDIPEDIFFADGFLGQRIYIIPSKKLVVVRMGYSMSNFNMNDFLREVIEAVGG